MYVCKMVNTISPIKHFLRYCRKLVHLVERELSLPNPINNVERVFDPPHEINIGAPALH